MPVVMPRAASTLIWKSVLKLSRFFGDHLLDAELHETLGRGGRANQAAAVFGHEINGGGRRRFTSHDEVALVFAVFVIHHDGHAALSQIVNDSLD